MPVSMVPVVELEPCAWADAGYDQLLGTEAWTPAWDVVLGRWNLKPLVPGSWHVTAADLVRSTALKRVVQRQLDRSGILGYPDENGDCGDDEEQLAALSGGYALLDAEGKVLFEPGCCCDLSDLRSWYDAVNHEGADSYRLMIGHGLYSVARDTEDYLVSVDPEVSGLDTVTFRVRQEELRLALTDASATREAFRGSLLEVLRELLNDDHRAQAISRILVGA